MYRIMMLDSLGQRYSMLPSQVLGSATTMDLYVLEKALWYQNLPRDDEGKVVRPQKKLTVEEMQAMVNRSKGQNNV